MHSKLLDEIGSMTITSASLPSSAFLKQCDIPCATKYSSSRSSSSSSSSSRAGLRRVNLGSAMQLHASAPDVRVYECYLQKLCGNIHVYI
jgi:hypothetical protein